MMEKRYLELIARGLKIGSNVPMRLSSPAAPLRCGDVLRFELELELPEGLGAALELEPAEANGITLTESPLKAVQRTSGTGLVHVPMALVIEGPPGQVLMEVVVKEEDFRATLGKTVEELTVLPPVIRVSTTGSGGFLDPVNGGSADLVLSRHGSDRTRCELELELLDGSGSKVPLRGRTHKDLTLKDELRLTIALVPEDRLTEGLYSLDATVLHNGIKDRTTLRDLFKVEMEVEGPIGTEKEDVVAGLSIKNLEAHPVPVLPGGTVTITLECVVHGMMVGPIRPVLRIGRADPAVIEMPPLDPSGFSRTLFVPGPETPGGDIPCELRLMEGDRTLLKEVHPRLIGIERSSQMETVWTLNTGRNIIALGDNVLGKENDPPRDREDARGLYVLHCTRNAFLDTEVVKMLKEGAAHETLLLDALEGTLAASEGMEKVCDGTTGWTGAAHRWGQTPKGPKSADVIEDISIREVQSILTSLFSGSREDGNITYLTDQLRPALERSVSGLRTSGARPRRPMTVKALRTISKRSASSLQLLMNAKESGLIRQGAVDLLMSMLLERLVRLETLTAWDDPVVNTWDELRSERQRMVKHGISGLLEVATKLAELERSALTRFNACMRNMTRRWSVASMGWLKGVPGSLTMSGTGGSIWERKLVLQVETGCSTIEIKAYLHLPGRSWQLLSPRSERRGELLDLGSYRTDGQRPLELGLEVQPPRSPPSEVKGLLYLIPEHFEMEEET
ncbi:MAG: hypothetical protein MUC62_05600 [Candidatus Thermoplasmatota archaeon]|nr:hypothetical protein [Candidatus Thermoplasmatota archaeon]